MTNTAVSGSKTSANGSGRYVFSTTSSQFNIGITAIGSPGITNLRVFHVNDEALLSAGQVFGVQFKNRLAEANFGVIRFLNWQQGNTDQCDHMGDPEADVLCILCGIGISSVVLYAGLTANSGAAYSVNLPGFQLVDKATVIVRFNASNSSACTLNVNGTGNINILNAYSTPLSSSNFPVAQRIATLVYDATLGAWIKQGGDAAMLSTGISNGCPRS